jgi:hypothetical protein
MAFKEGAQCPTITQLSEQLRRSILSGVGKKGVEPTKKQGKNPQEKKVEVL